MSLVPLPTSLVPFLEPYLPNCDQANTRPFVTLTYAQSLDSRIAALPGVQTKISHLETKTMTHYIRSKHDAILVGIGTILADDPKLNCRYDNHFIRPIVIDPHGKWDYHKSQLRRLVDLGQGLAPYVFIDTDTPISDENIKTLSEMQSGSYVRFPFQCTNSTEHTWNNLLTKMKNDLEINSIMIEGGAKIINDLLLLPQFIDSLIITIGPVFLGEGGVEVSPKKGVTLQNVTWWRGQQDSVMAAIP